MSFALWWENTQCSCWRKYEVSGSVGEKNSPHLPHRERRSWMCKTLGLACYNIFWWKVLDICNSKFSPIRHTKVRHLSERERQTSHGPDPPPLDLPVNKVTGAPPFSITVCWLHRRPLHPDRRRKSMCQHHRGFSRWSVTVKILIFFIQRQGKEH